MAKFDPQATRAGCTHVFRGRRGCGVTHAMVQYVCETRDRYETGAVLCLPHVFPDYLKQALTTVFPDVVFNSWQPGYDCYQTAQELCDKLSDMRGRQGCFVLFDDGYMSPSEVRWLKIQNGQWGLTLLKNGGFPYNYIGQDYTFTFNTFEYGSSILSRFTCVVTSEEVPALWQTNKDVLFRERAATVLQKCVRGWLFRKTQLWNVFTEVGQRHLRQRAKQIVENDC